MKKGILIAIDGLDGSGKETQSRELCRFLEERGIKYKCISFPNYNTKGCSLVEMYLQGQFGEDPMAVNAYAASSFFAMDRYSSYMLDWKKDYEEGTVITWFTRWQSLAVNSATALWNGLQAMNTDFWVCQNPTV